MPDVTQTATAPWEWQKGTKAYDPFAGMTPEQKNSPAFRIRSFGLSDQIDYKNAQKLIGTNAADALYGLWGDLSQQAGKAVPVTVKTEGWGDNATTRYFLPDGTEVFQNQYHEHGPQSIGGLVYEGGGEDGNGGQWVYRAPETVFNPRYGIRGSSTQENAEITRNLLRQVYPNATQEQLDTAAANALAKRGEHWNEEVNPTDIVRAIGAEMGGLPGQVDQYFKQNLDPKFDERRAKIREYRNKSDDASSGITGFLNDIGPVGQLAISATVPGGAQLVALANAAAGAEQGDWGKAAKGALTAYAGGQLGEWAKGFEGTTAGINNSTLANIGARTGIDVATGTPIDQALLNAGTSLAGSSGTNYLTGEGWNPDLAKAAVGAGLTGITGGDIGNYLSNQALKYGVNQLGKSDIAALPTDQVAALGDNNMSGINWFQGDEAAPEDWSSVIDQLFSPDNYDFSTIDTGIDKVPAGWGEEGYDGSVTDPYYNGAPLIDNPDQWGGLPPELAKLIVPDLIADNTSTWDKLNNLVSSVRDKANSPIGKVLQGALTQYLKQQGNNRNRAAYAAAQQAAQQRSPYFNATLQPVSTSLGAGGAGFTIPTPRSPESFVAPSTRLRG